jgi:hypothetical protein
MNGLGTNFNQLFVYTNSNPTGPVPTWDYYTPGDGEMFDKQNLYISGLQNKVGFGYGGDRIYKPCSLTYQPGTWCPQGFNSPFEVSSYIVASEQIRKIDGSNFETVVYREPLFGKCGVYNSTCKEWMIPDVNNVVMKNAHNKNCMETLYKGISLIQNASLVFPEPSYDDVFQWDFIPVSTEYFDSDATVGVL